VNANDLFLKFPEFNSNKKFEFNKPILFVGSCFSEDVASKAKYSGLNAHSNPLGTIYHPLVIQRFLSDILNASASVERIVNFQNSYFSFDAAYHFQNDVEQDLLNELEIIRKSWLNLVKTASHLFITFGSAWGYRHSESEILVANCLKMPGKFFKKELSTKNEIVQSWLNVVLLLKEINPELEICFTVSPVRHIRDGIIENNRSKAILIESVHEIVEKANLKYIPTYEIVIDVLRDYRFFKEDMVHPSEATVQIIWDWLSKKMVEEFALDAIKSIAKVRKAEAHKPINNLDDTYAMNRLKIALEKERLSKIHPEINW
jgi:hypothetical protein